MKTPRICLRMTAYHSVLASPEPWMRCHGGGGSAPCTIPAASSCRPVAT